ncbi:hypothetical protein C8R44DRAFT_749029 [Mycena epipterygia]|nr:hypothetical protein C8R44DRAFT_749029 [Mycena epipterygia]
MAPQEASACSANVNLGTSLGEVVPQDLIISGLGLIANQTLRTSLSEVTQDNLVLLDPGLRAQDGVAPAWCIVGAAGFCLHRHRIFSRGTGTCGVGSGGDNGGSAAWDEGEAGAVGVEWVEGGGCHIVKHGFGLSSMSYMEILPCDGYQLPNGGSNHPLLMGYIELPLPWVWALALV